jgi:putative sterol carrier protein
MKKGALAMGALVKPTQKEIREFYGQALERCLNAFAQIDEKEWSKKASEEWTAKQHLSYLVGTVEEETLPLTRQAIAGEPVHIDGFEKRKDIIPFRNGSMNKLRDLPVPELLSRMKTSISEHLQLLDGLSEPDLDRPANSPGWDRPGTIRDLFFGAYLFLPGQYQEIRKAAKKKLLHWVDVSTPEQTRYYMGRMFHYMPLIFRSDKAEDMNATYVFTMEGDGGGQWSIQIADGKAASEDGAPEAHDSEIRTKPQTWIDLSNGDINPAFAIMTRKVHLGGNPALAMKLGTLFSVEE